MAWIRRKWIILVLHIGALLPLILLFLDAWAGDLGANPVQAATLRMGKAALIYLILTLACSPIHAIFGWKYARTLRRWLGLYAFFYAGVHFLIFAGLDYGFQPALVREVFLYRRYALVGFFSGVILTMLALTSTKGWMQRLGRGWFRLHRLVYLAAIFAVVHYLWLVKADLRIPLIYAGIVLLLLLLRIPFLNRYLQSLRTR
jgi:sulfoxide reductase heme-binding subunit YedZ